MRPTHTHTWWWEEAQDWVLLLVDLRAPRPATEEVVPQGSAFRERVTATSGTISLR